MAGARRDGVIGNDGRFVRGAIGSVWWLAHERLTLVGVVAWRLRPRDSNGARAQAALAVFSGDDPARRRLIRWISVRLPRGTPVRTFRIVDLLEPTPAPWPGAVHSAITADEASVHSVVRVERCDGATPFDPAAVATVIELDAEAREDSAVDSIWLLGNTQGHVLGAYATTPYKPEPYDPSISEERLLLHHLALSAAGIALGVIAVLVTDVL